MSSSRHKVKDNNSLGTSDKEKFDHEKNSMKAKSLSVQAWYNINVYSSVLGRTGCQSLQKCCN